jgi:hypothetical protein
VTSMTWTKSPADLLGLGSVAVRPCIGIEVAVSPVLRSPITSVPGTGLPFGGTAVRMRPEVRQAGADALATDFVNAQPHNSIAVTNDGTPLGIHPSGRPTS